MGIVVFVVIVVAIGGVAVGVISIVRMRDSAVALVGGREEGKTRERQRASVAFVTAVVVVVVAAAAEGRGHGAGFTKLTWPRAEAGGGRRLVVGGGHGRQRGTVVKGVWTVAVAIGVEPMLIKKSRRGRRGGGWGRRGCTVTVAVMVVIVVVTEMVAAAVIALEEIKRVKSTCAVVVATIVVSAVVIETEVGLARVFKGGVEGGDGHCSGVVYLFL